jgi:hypothetical protein
MQSDSRRLSILSAGEIDDLYQLPQFTENDRHLYFDLSAEECKAVQSIHTFSVSVYLILQLGYFNRSHISLTDADISSNTSSLFFV